MILLIPLGSVETIIIQDVHIGNEILIEQCYFEFTVSCLMKKRQY